MADTLVNINIIRKRVLIAPLDWGLGHATRCIPVIRELLQQNFEVLMAGDEAVSSLLKNEFPEIKLLYLKGYRVKYSKTQMLFFVKMLTQIPKIIKAVKNENEWLNEIIKEHKIDIVISDNRYGLHNKNVYSIFMTHQLFISTGSSMMNWFAQKINYGLIKEFNECWVPDEEGNQNLAGILSHPNKKPPIPLKYVGILSRFTKLQVEKKIDLLVILSGPEPQRTVFEKQILKQLEGMDIRTILIRGLPQEKKTITIENKNVEIINHLAATELNRIICMAKNVIARSGYSTIMDMAVLQQRAVFIPTPGQTEQLYLAKYAAQKKYCTMAFQQNFNIKQELKKLQEEKLEHYPGVTTGALQFAIAQLK